MGLKATFTRREWCTLFAIGSVNFCTALCVSLQAPFYPQEAESKGATATEYGFVFGVYELIAFLSSPVLGKYMDTLGASFLLLSGIFVAGFSSMLFGILDLVSGHAQFIGLSFAVRIIESLGASAILTSSFSITATVFPNSVATVFATLETLFGLGIIVGPTVGGVLFSIGGFKLPFLVVGAILLFDGIFIFHVLPTIDDGINTRPQAQLLSFLKLTPVLLAAMSVTSAAIGTGFMSAVLEPHLRQFGLSAVSTGLVFVLMGATYAITAPLVGRLCDRGASPKTLVIVGAALVIVSFLVTGPAPFTPLDTQLWMVCLGMVLQGGANGCILVPAFIDAIRSAVACGLPDDITTYGVVSGLWASSFALGAFIGPSVAGALFDAVGFRVGTLFVVVVHSCLIVAMTTYVCLDRRRLHRPLCREVITASWSRDTASSNGDAVYGSVLMRNGDK